MRFLEIVIILGLLTYQLGFVFKVNRPGWVLVPGGILLVVSLHLFVEGYRWQMLPVYLLSLTLFSVSFKKALAYLVKHEVATLPFIRFNWLGWAFGLLAIILGASLCYLFPVFKIAKPGGAYPVGTRTYLFEDENRQELITGDPHDYRSLMIRLWYPAEDTKDLPNPPYISPKIARYIAERKAPLPFLLSHFNLIKTHSREGAPISDGQSSYPVLIFSHGYESHPSMYHSFVEEIASHGYIIFFINHTYESSGTAFLDGTIAYTDTATVSSSFDWSKIEPYYNKVLEATNEEEKTKAVFAAMKSVGFNDRVKYWAKDVKYLIDQISDEGFHHAFKDKMDLQNLGIIGHSIGGSVAVEMLMKDSRIKAGVNLDGGQYGEVLDSAVSKPFMYVQADRSPPEFDPNPSIYKKIIQHDFYTLKLKGASHSNFYDVAFWSRFKGLTGAGDINPKECFRITNQGILLFFDHYLKGKDRGEFIADLNELPGTQVEVKLNKPPAKRVEIKLN